MEYNAWNTVHSIKCIEYDTYNKLEVYNALYTLYGIQCIENNTKNTAYIIQYITCNT